MRAILSATDVSDETDLVVDEDGIVDGGPGGFYTDREETERGPDGEGDDSAVEDEVEEWED